MTWATVSAPCGWASRMVEPVMVMDPGAVSMMVLGVTRPVCSAQAVTKGFMVEPGSKMSVSARFRSCAPLRPERWLGL